MAADSNEDDLIERSKNIVFDDPSLAGAESDMHSSLLKATYSAGMDFATQVSLEIIDPDFSFAKNNYFQITRDVYFKTTKFQDSEGLLTSTVVTLPKLEYQRLEIAAVTCQRGRGSSPVWTVECRTKAMQQMRRDKDPASISGTSYDFVVNAAQKYGMGCFAEQTGKTRQINKASNDRAADSTWDVIKNLASQAKFVTFESDSILFFTSQKHLMGQWGSTYTDEIEPEAIFASGAIARDAYNVIPIRWPSSSTMPFQLMELPTVRKSDNDPLAVQGSMLVDRASGTALRPGMTIYLGNYPTMEGMYLISSVSYDILSSDPVRVDFRSAEREAKDIRQYDVGTTFSSTFIDRGF